MTRPDDPPNDDLIAHYHEASAQDTRRPAGPVREAVLAHARMVNASSHRQAAGHDAGKAAPANQSRWKLSLLASVALAALSGLLVLQFDRGTPEAQDAAYGQRSAPAGTVPPLPAAAPAAVQPPTPPAAAVPSFAPAPPAPPAKPAKPQAGSPQPVPPGTAQADADAGTTRGETSGRRASAAPLAPDPVPGASVREPAREQAAPLAFPAAPAPVRSMAPPAPAAAAAPGAADAASLRSAAPVQKQERQEGQESLVLQTPRARLEPGSPAAAMAMALHESARTGRITQLVSLLRQGAPINAPDAAGRTPLALAVIHGQTAVVQRLLAAGANTALVDRDGLNALQHAQRLGLGQIASLIAAAS